MTLRSDDAEKNLSYVWYIVGFGILILVIAANLILLKKFNVIDDYKNKMKKMKSEAAL